MIRSLCLKIISMLTIAVVILITLLTLPETTRASRLSPASSQRHNAHTTSSFLPINAFHLRGIDGPYHTQGNLIYGSDNYPYLFHGIARDDLEYFCQGDGHYSAQYLAYMGLGNNAANQTYWDGNVVRLPLSENFWLYGHPSENCSANQYKTLVKQTVDNLTNLNLNVILDLEWTNGGGQAVGSGTQLAMPDADSVTFWQQLATIYAGYPNVLFEVFNEPHLYNWPCWVNGCQIVNDVGTNNQSYTYAGVGMQKLVDTVRATGATNLVLVGGLDWGYNLSQLPTYHLRGSNIVYDTHPYDYYGKQPSNWEADFGSVSGLFPLFTAEMGEYDCGTNYISQLVNFLDAHDISWVGWAWVVVPNGNPCRYPQVVTNYTGSPVAGMGQWEYQHLKGYLSLLVKQEVPEQKK